MKDARKNETKQQQQTLRTSVKIEKLKTNNDTFLPLCLFHCLRAAASAAVKRGYRATR